MAGHEKQESIFTNTRLMLAGLILGGLGMLFAIVYINGKVAEKIGGENVRVCVMKEDLPMGELFKERMAGEVEIPAKAYEAMGEKLITMENLHLWKDKKACRRLEAGEPLVSLNFETGGKDVGLPSPRPGEFYRTLKIDPSIGAGQGLAVGSVVNAIGNFNFDAKDRTGRGSASLRVLERVRIMAINGQVEPKEKDRTAPKQITIVVNEETSLLLEAIQKYLEGGFYDLEVMSKDTSQTVMKDQVPTKTRDTLEEQLQPKPEKEPKAEKELKTPAK